MDLLEAVVILVPVLLSAIVALRWISAKDAAMREQARQKARISAQNSRAARMKGSASSPVSGDDVGPWVADLLSEFGVDPDVLFEDEMPRELQALIPVARGFIQGGGLQKLLAGGGDGEQKPQDERASI